MCFCFEFYRVRLHITSPFQNCVLIHSCLYWASVHVQSLSHVWLFTTPWNVTCQAPLSLDFSRQEYWSELSFPTPGGSCWPGIEPTSLSSPALAGGRSSPLCYWGSTVCQILSLALEMLSEPSLSLPSRKSQQNGGDSAFTWQSDKCCDIMIKVCTGCRGNQEQESWGISHRRRVDSENRFQRRKFFFIELWKMNGGYIKVWDGEGYYKQWG